MEARAYLKFVRISPRKVKIVCDLIRGQDAKTAVAYLQHTPKAATEPMLKLLNSALQPHSQENHPPHHRRERAGIRQEVQYGTES